MPNQHISFEHSTPQHLRPALQRARDSNSRTIEMDALGSESMLQISEPDHSTLLSENERGSRIWIDEEEEEEKAANLLKFDEAKNDDFMYAEECEKQMRSLDFNGRRKLMLTIKEKDSMRFKGAVPDLLHGKIMLTALRKRAQQAQEVFVHEESKPEEKLLAEAESLLKREEKQELLSGTWFKPKSSRNQVMPIARESAGLLYPGKFNDVSAKPLNHPCQVLLFGGISN